ncbi:hypothetical protein EYF80_017140 [Liparis tanakae]|uniref:Uncharacterized protein n=1 Tax=Liparis tanakae TaxID=230148 RepID=A0A4Z2I4J4_9TELE|nr:hypothetical protein EYF80_017140 [Liparis tanakae]
MNHKPRPESVVVVSVNFMWCSPSRPPPPLSVSRPHALCIYTRQPFDVVAWVPVDKRSLHQLDLRMRWWGSGDVNNHQLPSHLPCTARATDATAAPHTPTVGERQSVLPQPIKSPQDHSGPLEGWQLPGAISEQDQCWMGGNGRATSGHLAFSLWALRHVTALPLDRIRMQDIALPLMDLLSRKRDTLQRSTLLGLLLALKFHLHSSNTQVHLQSLRATTQRVEVETERRGDWRWKSKQHAKVFDLIIHLNGSGRILSAPCGYQSSGRYTEHSSRPSPT